MMISAQVQLAAAIVLVYLLDCLALLHVNEGIVEQHGRAWRVGFGSTQPWVAGKRLRLLDPTRPLVAAYRGTWQIRSAIDSPGSGDAAAARLAGLMPAWRALAPFVIVVAALVLVALPLALCTSTTLNVLLVAAAGWISAWALVIRLWTLRRTLELSTGAFLLAAFECLACPPTAANVVRKLSMRMPLGADIVDFVVRLPDAPARDAAIAHIDRDVDARMVFLDPEGSGYSAAVRYREALAGERARSDHPVQAGAGSKGESA